MSNRSTTRPPFRRTGRRPAPGRALAAAGLVVLVAGGAAACSTVQKAVGGINESTTCSEYLGYSNEARSAAVRTLGVKAGWKDAGNPMSVMNVDSHCGQRPNQTLGQALALFAK